MYTQYLCLLVVMVTRLYQLDGIYIKVRAILFTTLSNNRPFRATQACSLET